MPNELKMSGSWNAAEVVVDFNLETFKETEPGFEFGVVFQCLKIVSGIWHVKAYDSYKWKLAGSLLRHCTLSLVVWHPLKAAARIVPCCHGARQKELTPGGNESRGGLVPLDLCTREALDFKVKLPEYTAVHVGEWGEQRMESSSPGSVPPGLSGYVSQHHYFLQGLSASLWQELQRHCQAFINQIQMIANWLRFLASEWDVFAYLSYVQNH